MHACASGGARRETVGRRTSRRRFVSPPAAKKSLAPVPLCPSFASRPSSSLIVSVSLLEVARLFGETSYGRVRSSPSDKSVRSKRTVTAAGTVPAGHRDRPCPTRINILRLGTVAALQACAALQGSQSCESGAPIDPAGRPTSVLRHQGALRRPPQSRLDHISAWHRLRSSRHGRCALEPYSDQHREHRPALSRLPLRPNPTGLIVGRRTNSEHLGLHRLAAKRSGRGERRSRTRRRGRRSVGNNATSARHHRHLDGPHSPSNIIRPDPPRPESTPRQGAIRQHLVGEKRLRGDGQARPDDVTAGAGGFAKVGHGEDCCCLRAAS